MSFIEILKDNVKKTTFVIGFICLFFFISKAQNLIQKQDKYLIVLDVQPQFYADSKLQPAAIEMIKHINSLIDITDPRKIIYVKSAGKMLELSFKHISVDTIPASPMDSNLKIVGNAVFTKMGGDAFTTPDLLVFLKENQVKEIILTGLLAEKCISNTALGGKEKGYDIFIVPEAVIGKNLKSKEKALTKLKDNGIKILTISVFKTR
jgi:nicotinamidase-related amidase